MTVHLHTEHTSLSLQVKLERLYADTLTLFISYSWTDISAAFTLYFKWQYSCFRPFFFQWLHLNWHLESFQDFTFEQAKRTCWALNSQNFCCSYIIYSLQLLKVKCSRHNWHQFLSTSTLPHQFITQSFQLILKTSLNAAAQTETSVTTSTWMFQSFKSSTQKTSFIMTTFPNLRLLPKSYQLGNRLRHRATEIILRLTSLTKTQFSVSAQ